MQEQETEGSTPSPVRPLVRRLLAVQPIRYLFVAGCVALFYLGVVAAGLSLGLHYFIAILIAQAVTICGAFPIYRTWVFESRSALRMDFLRFLTVWVSGAVAGIVLAPILVEVLRWHPLAAQVVAIAGVSVASFLGHRFFSFRSSPDRQSATLPKGDR